MKKVPEITLQDWLDAEQSVKRQNDPKPTGITAREYGVMRNLSYARSRAILDELYEAGRATRQSWLSNGHKKWVYNLKK